MLCKFICFGRLLFASQISLFVCVFLCKIEHFSASQSASQPAQLLVYFGSVENLCGFYTTNKPRKDITKYYIGST